MGFCAFILRKYLILVNIGERGPLALLSKHFCAGEAERFSFYRKDTTWRNNLSQVLQEGQGASQEQQPCLSVVLCY